MKLSCPQILILAAIPLLLPGCATSQDGRTAQAQATAIGTVSGGALGFLAGSLLSKDSDGAAVGTLIGAAAGGAVGYAYGTSVAKRKEKYASTEAWLQQEIALTHQANTQIQAHNQTLAAEITALEQRAKKAREAQDKAQIASIKNAVEKIRASATKQASTEKRVALDIKDVLADSQAKNATADYASYKTEAVQFDRAIAERGVLLTRLASLEQSLN